MEETKKPKIISITNNGVFSDDMVITWRVSQPVNTVLLYSDKDCNITQLEVCDISDNREYCKGIPMDEYYANVIVFPEPVTMSIPAARHDTEHTPAERKIIVQGTVAEVLSSIYQTYQQPATEKEIQLANKHTSGSKGDKLIDQMSDLVFFEGWKYYQEKKEASLFLGS